MAFGNSSHRPRNSGRPAIFSREFWKKGTDRPTQHYSLLRDETLRNVKPAYKRKLGNYIQHVDHFIAQGDKASAVEYIDAILDLYKRGAIQRGQADERGLINSPTTRQDWENIVVKLKIWKPGLRKVTGPDLMRTLG